MNRLPGGIARSDYSRPCPGCDQKIVAGDAVRKVTLKTTTWWHEACRAAEVKRLVSS